MNKRLKAAWVKALRSGKYRQGKGSLKEENLSGETEFCCLGVLNEVAGVQQRYCFNFPHSKTYLGTHKAAAEEKLIRMNDGVIVKRRSFKAIATWIEKNL